MNRRNFLKSLGKVCGAAVVAPAVLLKSKCEHNYRWFAVKNSDAPAWFPVFDYDKHHHYEHTCTLCRLVREKQQILSFGHINLDRPMLPWKNYYLGCYDPLSKTFKSKIELPESNGIRGERSKFFYNGIPT